MLLCPAQGHTAVKVSSGIFKLRLNPGNVPPWPARIQTAVLSASRGWLVTSLTEPRTDAAGPEVGVRCPEIVGGQRRCVGRVFT
jgi:hypothetical protein